MKLKVKCRNCKEEFNLKKSFVTRPDLIDAMGEEFSVQCSQCLSQNTVHANDVVAYQSTPYRLAGSLLGIAIIIIITLFWWDAGYISNMGLILGGGIIAASNFSSVTSNVTAFNTYKITRR